MANYDYRELLAKASNRRLDPNTKLAAINENDNKPEFTETLKYVLVSMSPVEGRSTQIYNEEAERVEKQLSQMPAYSLEFARQGSVPLNVHIRTVSDIDILCVNLAFFHGQTRPGTNRVSYRSDPLAEQRSLRNAAAERLRNAYWGANVDDQSSGKAIKISGGSLRRQIDVVIASWFYTDRYTRSGSPRDRAVNVYDASIPTLVFNDPFLHMDLIDARDARYFGSHRRYIRLLKCLREDLSINGLSSYDIASMVYHCLDERLLKTHSILENLQYLENFLYLLHQNDQQRESLDVPNGTRKLFEGDAGRKYALTQLWLAVYNIVRDLATAPVRRYLVSGTMIDVA